MALIGTPKVIAPAALTASSATYYTVPGATTSILKELSICNTDTVPRTVTIYHVPSGGAPAIANTLFNAWSLAANETKLVGLSRVMATGDTLRALASVAAVVGLSGSVIEGA